MGWLTKPSKHARYGWLPDLPDIRDHRYALAPHLMGAVLPALVDLRDKCPPVFDQGQLGSCTANAIANAHLFEQHRQHNPDIFTPSRLFIYYNERDLEGTVDQDSGAQIRDGFKTLADLGVCGEWRVPYNIGQFTRKPSDRAYEVALEHRSLVYRRLDNTQLDQLRGCLVDGTPFVFGFTVYESFESDVVARTGVVPLPADGEQTVGGHAVLCVGYDDSKQRFLVMNSWGTGWGMSGYFTIPYAYLTNTDLADDFWTVTTVEV